MIKRCQKAGLRQSGVCHDHFDPVHQSQHQRLYLVERFPDVTANRFPIGPGDPACEFLLLTSSSSFPFALLFALLAYRQIWLRSSLKRQDFEAPLPNRPTPRPLYLFSLACSFVFAGRMFEGGAFLAGVPCECHFSIPRAVV